jgi:hypothetical protein
VLLKSGREELPVAVGPVAYRRGSWMLPRFHQQGARASNDVAILRRESARLRRRYGLD